MQIKKIIQTGMLDFCDNGLTLIGYLAQTNNHVLVDKLAVNSADIAQAVFGYALAGNNTQVSAWLVKFPQYSGSAVSGYARAGDWLNLDIIDPAGNYQVDRVFGLAQSGNKQLVASILDNNITLLPQAINGYATCNHVDLITQLIAGTNCYPLAIYYAARSGHTMLVAQLLLQCGITPDVEVVPSTDYDNSKDNRDNTNAYYLLNYAAKGYAAGRHFAAAGLMLDKGCSAAQCITELKDAQGAPSALLCSLLLATTQDPAAKSQLLDIMKAFSKVLTGFTIDTDVAVLREPITLSFLAQQLLELPD